MIHTRIIGELNLSTKWKTVKLPAVIADKVDSLLEKEGYRSRSEYVTDIVRRRLERLEQSKKFGKLTEEQLIDAANEYTKAYGNLDPEGVCKFLKELYWWLPVSEIDRGVQEICSMKIKN